MSVHATLLLAHAVNQNLAGEMNVLGLGWSLVGPEPVGSHQVVILLANDNEPNWFDEPRSYVLQLIDPSGEVVTAPDDVPLRLTLHITPQGDPEPTPPGAKGSRAAMAMNMNVLLPLSPGRYVYQLFADGEPRPIGEAAFYVQSKSGEYKRNRAVTIDIEVG